MFIEFGLYFLVLNEVVGFKGSLFIDVFIVLLCIVLIEISWLLLFLNGRLICEVMFLILENKFGSLKGVFVLMSVDLFLSLDGLFIGFFVIRNWGKLFNNKCY